MGYVTLTEATLRETAEAYRAGMTMAQIARRDGVARSTVWQRLQRAGIRSRRTGPPRTSPRSPRYCGACGKRLKRAGRESREAFMARRSCNRACQLATVRQTPKAKRRREAMTPTQRAGMRELERLLAAGARLDLPSADVVSGALRAVWDRAEDGMEVGA